MKNKLKQIILLAGDIILLFLSLYLALLIRYFEIPTSNALAIHILPFSLIFIGWLVIFYIFNLYNLHLAVNNSRFLQALFKGIIISSGASIIFFYLTPQFNIAPKTNLLIFIIIFTVLILLWRLFYNWLLKSYMPKTNIIIVGYNDRIDEIINEIRSKPHLGYNITALIDEEEKIIKERQNNFEILSNLENLIGLVKRKNISAIVLSNNPHQSEKLRSILFDCIPLKVNFVSLANFYENITGKIPIDSINQMWFLENLSESNKSFFDFFKRVYDIIFALLLIIASLPFWPFIALIIKLESKGPVFFVQTRAGKNNKPFNLIKFRTMKEEENDRTLTIEGDKRITKFGSFMRKTRIDELPQVLNILNGDISLVGPRPERPVLIKELEKKIPFYNERTLVKPGITGWDQISGEYHSPSYEDTLKKIQYDLFYIKNRSIYLDLSIILKTISTVLSKGGR